MSPVPAILVRLRQEAMKRVEGRWRRWRWPDGAAPLAPQVPGDPATALSAPGFTPWWATFPERSGDAAPADAAAILAEADAVLAGRFQVLGRRLPAFERTGDWGADPVTGRPLPEGDWYRVPYLAGGLDSDVKVVWELNRHHGLVRLAQGWHLTGRTAHAERLAGLLDDWIEQDRPGRGLAWSSSLEVAFRAAAWCWAWALTRSAPVWTEGRMRRLLSSLSWHAAHVARYDSTHHSPNTHLTGEALGLLYVGSTFPGLGGAGGWRRRAVAILRREAGRQVLPDGMHFERSTCYHRYTLEFWAHWLRLVDRADAEVRDEVAEVLARLAGAARSLRPPCGTWPVLGDEDGGRFVRLGGSEPTEMQPLLDAADAMLGRPGASAAGGDAWWLVRGASPGTGPRPAVRPDEGGRSLPDAGYLIGPPAGTRSPWHVLVDAGPLGVLGGGHGHADLGHVEVAREGRAVVTDSGCGVYGADPALRDRFRSERAHARPVLDGRPLAVEGDAFGWRTRYGRPEWWEGAQGGAWYAALRYRLGEGAASLTHLRWVVVLAETGVLVLDAFRGTGRVRGSLRWPLASTEASPGPDGAMRVAEVVVETRVLDGAGGADRVAEGRLEPFPRAPTYGRVEDGLVLDVPVAEALPFAVATTFGDEPWMEGLERMEDDRIIVRVHAGKGPGGLALSLGGGRPRLEVVPGSPTAARGDA